MGTVDIPFLANQPGWVVIVVVLLLILGAWGILLLRRGKEDADPATVIGDNTAVVLKAAMEHLADTAKQTRRENRELRKQLQECADELVECQQRGRQLAAKAWEDADESG